MSRLPSLPFHLTKAALALALCILLPQPGCSSTDGDTEGEGSGSQAEISGPLQDTWMFLVASDPTALGPIEGDAAWDPWFALFHNDLRKAQELFGRVCQPSAASLSERAAVGYLCVGLARTHLELSAFYADAAELDRVVLRQFHQHRSDKADEVLPSLHSDFFAGLVLHRSGDSGAAVELLKSYIARTGADPLLCEVARLILAGDDPAVARIWGSGVSEVAASSSLSDLPASPAAANYAARIAFMSAVAQGDVSKADGLLRPIRSSLADLVETLEGSDQASAIKPTLKHHDPALLVALSRFHALAAQVAIGGAPDLALLSAQAERLLGRSPNLPESAPSLRAGLSLVLFSSVPSPKDLLTLERSYPTGVATLSRVASVEPALGTAPTRNIGDLDPFVSGSNKLTIRLGELIEASGPKGEEMDMDMELSERFRGQLLSERAAHYQASFDVRLDEKTGSDIATAGVAARSLLELALDKNPTPPNSALRAARISLRNDPTLLMALARAELDTRRPSEANDYVRPLSSVYPELVPLRDALTLLDTAWNPPRVGAVQK